jgi:hypothetical protein
MGTTNRVRCAASCMMILPTKGHSSRRDRDCYGLTCSRNQNLLHILFGIDEMIKQFNIFVFLLISE